MAASDHSRSATRSWLIVIGIAGAMGVLAWLLVRVANDNAGGPSEYFFAKVFGDDTEYASGYDEKRFAELKTGADEASVLRELGEPFLRQTNRRRGVIRWVYSRSPGSANYRVRQVVMQNGNVSGKIASYYWD